MVAPGKDGDGRLRAHHGGTVNAAAAFRAGAVHLVFRHHAGGHRDVHGCVQVS